MCRDLAQIISHYCSTNFRDGKPAPRYILNTLCTALAYLTIHTHQIWPTLVSDLTTQFSGDLEQALCLMRILKYMADDCDNEQIVVEESLKQSYYHFLDSHARLHIFKNIFSKWAENLPLLVNNANAQNDQAQKTKVMLLHNRLMDTFLAWIKLALPAEVFDNLLTENQPLIDLVFQQLGTDDDDNLHVATSVVVELMKNTRVAKNKIAPFIDVVVSKQQALQEMVQQVIESGDNERAEQFTHIFVEISFSKMDQIID